MTLVICFLQIVVSAAFSYTILRRILAPVTGRRLTAVFFRVNPSPARALHKIDHHFRVLVDDKKISRSRDTETPKSLELYKSQTIHCFSLSASLRR